MTEVDVSISTCLKNGSLRELFIEHLGWDHSRGTVSVSIGEARFELERIAHKRGFQVLRLVTDRVSVHTRRFVQDIHKQLLRIAHDHLLIIQDPAAGAQVWAWALRDPDSKRVRHRFHPFFTERIPDRLLKRIERLAVSLGEEEDFTLFDLLGRTQDALDTEADAAVFFRRPGYAKQSHELAVRMRDGGQPEFDEFVLFHAKLAKWFSKRFRRICSDLEGLEQEAMVGLVRAARRFDPDRGVAFSTYAYSAMRNECYRALPNLVGVGRIPDYLHWPYHRVLREWRRGEVEGGVDMGRDALNEALKQEGIDERAALRLYRFFHPVSLDDDLSPQLDIAAGGVDYSQQLGFGRYRTPEADVSEAEICHILLGAVLALDSRSGEIVRRRYGLDAKPMTLEQLGRSMNLTRERVRQLESQALDCLKTWLVHDYGFSICFQSP